MHSQRLIASKMVKLAGLLSPWYVWRCSRHAWLKVQCLMGGRGWQASEPMLVPWGARGMHGWRHSVSWVVEACMVGGIGSHEWSRFVGLSVHGCASRWSMYALLEAH